MSTRGVMGFRLKETDYAFYNGYDSYPDGLGLGLVAYLQSRAQIAGYDGAIGELKQRVGSLHPFDEKVIPSEQQKKWCLGLGIVNLNVGKCSMDDWYCLLRGAQGNIDKSLEAGFYDPTENFVLDSLFCEYAYIINLDDETFEFYRGFIERNGVRHEGRYWASVPDAQLLPFAVQHRNTRGDKFERINNYGPVKLVLTTPLAGLMSIDALDMVALLNEHSD